MHWGSKVKVYGVPEGSSVQLGSGGSGNGSGHLRRAGTRLLLLGEPGESRPLQERL